MLVISTSWMLVASSFGMLVIHELEVSRMQPLILGCQDIIWGWFKHTNKSCKELENGVSCNILSSMWWLLAHNYGCVDLSWNIECLSTVTLCIRNTVNYVLTLCRTPVLFCKFQKLICHCWTRSMYESLSSMSNHKLFEQAYVFWHATKCPALFQNV